MAPSEVSCPICNADIPLSGDELAGEEIFCAYCSAPCKLSSSSESDDCKAEEDF